MSEKTDPDKNISGEEGLQEEYQKNKGLFWFILVS